MTKYMLAGLAVLALLAPATASGLTTADAPYDGWLEDGDMPALPAVEVAPPQRCAEEGNTSSPLGCTDGHSYVALADFGDRFTFLHEEGHVFDYTYLRVTPGAYEHISAIVDRPHVEWGSWAAGWGQGAMEELFADAFADCVRLPYIKPTWELSVGPTLLVGWRLSRLCAYVRSF